MFRGHGVVLLSRLLFAVLATLSVYSTAFAVEPPTLLDPSLEIELIASEPGLVTPTGCCFDDQGRLLVIECHTHFPPEDYAGPKIDRIYRYDDSDGNGSLDRQTLFYEGGVATMNIANLRDGWFAVATRSEVVRIRDGDGDGVADQRDVLLTHKTAATYPHNGLGGLTLGSDGWLYVGQGENFGEPYELIGTDGSRQIGGGEGGNVFRCQPDGSRLQRFATGFWNPFGLTMDSVGRLFAVGNDPDAMPPNRFMHVAKGGDYGFQFRFGRAGIHPLQCWNGELPGTLPMITGTGEAACAVAIVDDRFWATSWGDNRVERYKLEPRGGSWQSKTEVIVQGDANFRPVGIAVAPDGSVLISDWVDRSYSVHGKGRLWRISRKGSPQTSRAAMPVLNGAETMAKNLATSTDVTIDQRLEALKSDDPFVRQAATIGLVDLDQLGAIEIMGAQASTQRVGLLTAWRWKELSDPASVSIEKRNRWLHASLQNQSEDVLLTSLRWATERGCKEELPTIRSLLDRDDLAPRVFAAIVASIAYLETGSASGKQRDPAIEKFLSDFAGNAGRPAKFRALALQKIPVDAETPGDAEMRAWLADEPDRSLALEVVRLLTARSTGSAKQQLASIVNDSSIDEQTRADALAGLSLDHHGSQDLIKKMAQQTELLSLRNEAQLGLHSTPNTSDIARPNRDDLDAWEKIVEGGGSADAGRRVFMRRACITCHMHSGRGAKTGPDLTTLSGRMTPRRILESILQPSKEVGPLYVPWTVLTKDGSVLTGLKLDAPGVATSARFQGADGKIFDVPLVDIEMQKPIDTSIMPLGLEETMSADELRDLIAFLTQK